MLDLLEKSQSRRQGLSLVVEYELTGKENVLKLPVGQTQLTFAYYLFKFFLTLQKSFHMILNQQLIAQSIVVAKDIGQGCS